MDFLFRIAILALGYFYPAYKYLKVIDYGKPKFEQLYMWCLYWIIIAIFIGCERTADTFIPWLPFYSGTKLVFVVYLWHPDTKEIESRKGLSDNERTDTDKDQEDESDCEDIPKGAEAKGPLEFERSDEEDTSTPLEKKSQKPRSKEQVLMDEAMARVDTRRKELADARAAKATKIAKPTTMEEANKQRMEKAKALQKERKRLEAEEKAQEEAETAQAAQTQEKEIIDLMGTIEYLKKIEKEKHIAEQQTSHLAREKIKEALSRKAEEPILEPSQGSPKRPRQEEEEEMEHIQADPIPSSPMNIPLAPPSSSITPFPLASTLRTPSSPTTLDPPRSPLAPASPHQQQQPSVEPSEAPPSIQEEKDQSMDRIEEEKKQADTDKPKRVDIELQIPLM
ncbi:hypothetical protein L7F22_018274 [Adiantum nelumboides]|nr:hypothetical protein [Adiantum nelumboides]